MDVYQCVTVPFVCFSTGKLSFYFPRLRVLEGSLGSAWRTSCHQRVSVRICADVQVLPTSCVQHGIESICARVERVLWAETSRDRSATCPRLSRSIFRSTSLHSYFETKVKDEFNKHFSIFSFTFSPNREPVQLEQKHRVEYEESSAAAGNIFQYFDILSRNNLKYREITHMEKISAHFLLYFLNLAHISIAPLDSPAGSGIQTSSTFTFNPVLLTDPAALMNLDETDRVTRSIVELRHQFTSDIILVFTTNFLH